jgi:hypothetical protein
MWFHSYDLRKHFCGFFFERDDILPYRVTRTELLRLVKVAGEADFVPDLGRGFVNRRISEMGQEFPADEGLYSAGFEQGHLFGIAQFRVGLILDTLQTPIDADLE